MNARRTTLVAITALAGTAVAFAAGRGYVRLSESVSLARQSEPYRQPARDPCARLLVAGDSTAVGTGAANARASVAGLIGAQFPGAEIVNLGVDGARIGEVAGQIERASAGRYDLVLIQAGGNDVIRFTERDALAQHWRRTLSAAAARSDDVVVMPAGNVGTAPIFPPPLSWLLTWRARQASSLAREAAQAAGARFIDLFHERAGDPFLRDPERYYASDGLHPSAAGYALWYEQLERAGALAALTRGCR